MKWSAAGAGVLASTILGAASVFAASVPVVTSVQMSPNAACIEQGALVGVAGQNFGKAMGSLLLTRAGEKQLLKVQYWSPLAITAKITEAVREGQSYQLFVERVSGERSSAVTLSACPAVKPAAPPPVQPVQRPSSAPPPATGGADLTIRVLGPTTATAGEPLGTAFRFEVRNTGGAVAPGTSGPAGTRGGYQIALELTKGGWLNTGGAEGRRNLLRNGHVSSTFDLAPGASRSYQTAAEIPPQTAAGRYRLCARVDAEDRIPETNERNNSDCLSLTVVAGRPADLAGDAAREAGRDLGRQPGAGISAAPVLPDPASLKPGAILPVVAYLTLKVNGQPGVPDPVSVGAGESLDVSWESVLPDVFGGGDVTGIHPRIRRSPFPSGDCAGGPGTWTEDLPLSPMRWYDGEWLPTGATGSFNPVGAEDPPDQFFYVKACVRSVITLGAEAPSEIIYSDTNEVGVRYGEGLDPWRLGRWIHLDPTLLLGSLPDLVVRDIWMNPAGTELKVWFGADPATPGVPPPLGEFRYAIDVGDPLQREWFRFTISDDDPRHLVALGESHWLEGVARVGPLFILGYGAFVEVPVTLPEGSRESWAVRAWANTERPGQPAHYAESNGFNNTMTKLFRARPDSPLPDVVQDLRREAGGDSWAIIDVTYTLDSLPSAVLDLVLSDESASPGEVVCTSGTGANRVSVQRGLNRTARFLCMRPESFPSAGGMIIAVASLRASGDERLMTGRAFPVELGWGVDERTPPGLCNLAPGSHHVLSVPVPPSGPGTPAPGVGGEVFLSIQNRSSTGRAPGSTALFQIREPGPARPGSVLFERLIEVPQLNPSGEWTHRFTIPPEVTTEGKTAKLQVDYRGTVFESQESDNIVTWTVSREGGGGRMVVLPQRVGTGVRRTFYRSNSVFCGWRGDDFPPRFAPPGSAVAAGFSHDWEGGALCDWWEEFVPKGYVWFGPLSRLPMRGLARATLRFTGRDAVSENCPAHRVSIAPAHSVAGLSDWRRREGPVFFWTTSDIGSSAGGGSVSGGEISGLTREADGWSLDVTDYVREVIELAPDDQGLEISVPHGRLRVDADVACIKHIGDFTLELSYE